MELPGLPNGYDTYIMPAPPGTGLPLQNAQPMRTQSAPSTLDANQQLTHMVFLGIIALGAIGIIIMGLLYAMKKH